jgi:hypothetical protein
VVAVAHGQDLVAAAVRVASIRAVSLASVPEVVKKTRASGMPDNWATRSASSTIGRLR